MKLKYITPLVIIVAAILIVNRTSKTTTKVVSETEAVATTPTAEKTVTAQPEIPAPIASSAPEATIPAPLKIKKKTGMSQKEIARETEQEFMAMNIPSSFSDVKEVRYQEMYTIYQKSSFYLNEIAAGHLDTTRENLLKAFTGLATYYRENSMRDQMDSSLVIISEEKPGLFEETLRELPKKDQEIIKTVLKLQSESQ